MIENGVPAGDLGVGERVRDDDGNVATVERVVEALSPDECVVHMVDALGYRRARRVPRRRLYEVLPAPGSAHSTNEGAL